MLERKRKKHDYADRLKYMRLLETGRSFKSIHKEYGIDSVQLRVLWEKYKYLEIQEGACTFAPQTLEMIERLSSEHIQQKQGFRENDSTFARVKD